MSAASPQQLLESALSQRLAGNWQGAVALSEEAFRLGWHARDSRQVTEALLAIAHAYREMGDAEVAEEFYALAQTISLLHEDLGQASRALNGSAILLQGRGEMDRAEAAYGEARRLALLDGDALTIGNIDMNLGTLHAIRGDWETARTYYDDCLVRYEAISHERGIIGVLNNLGMLHIDFGRLEDASECLERALQMSRRAGDVLSEATIQLNITELLIEQGSLDAARTSCDEAFEIFSRVGEESGRSDALKHYGVIYRETGKLYLAEAHLKDAIALAASNGHVLQEAEARRELALVLRLLGKNQAALQALNEAYLLFSKLQAAPQEFDIRQRLQKLEDDFLSVVSYWSESIDEKDEYTRGHCQRVAGYACMLAERAGFHHDSIPWLRMGALLHDVGKTVIPLTLLNKPSNLSSEERAVVEQHTILGERLLSGVEFPWDIRPMIRSHHERWDGKGYPDGLKGEEIPFAARILRIADVFDALTTTRSYRSRLAPRAALDLMLMDSGAFDPTLLHSFDELVVNSSGSSEINVHSEQVI